MSGEFPESQLDKSQNMEFLAKGDFATFDPTLFPGHTSIQKKGPKNNPKKRKK